MYLAIAASKFHRSAVALAAGRDAPPASASHRLRQHSKRPHRPLPSLHASLTPPDAARLSRYKHRDHMRRPSAGSTRRELRLIGGAGHSCPPGYEGERF